MKKKLLSIFMIVVFVGVIFISACSGDTEQGQNLNETSGNVSSEVEETEVLRENTPDTLPSDLNFGGETITVHIRGDAQSTVEMNAELTGDVIEDAVYYRNQAVEERLNIKLETYVAEGWEAYNTAIANLRGSIMAGDDTYDIIAGWSARIPQLSIEGLFMDLYDVDYLDMSKPWWVQSLITELDIAGTLNFLTGDIALTLMRAAYVIYFNKTVEQNFELESLYDIVNRGDWTIDKMAEITKGISNDLNGDGVMDENDMYGGAFTAVNQVDCFLQGSNISMIKKDSDGFPVLDVEYEKLTVLVEKIYSFMFENPGVLCITGNENNFSTQLNNMFMGDRALLVAGPLDTASSTFKEMDSDYGIIPYPKYDSNQAEYYTRIQDSVSLWCIPITNSAPNMAGAVMEAMAAESYRKLTPAYYEIAMKVKYSRDDVSSQMLDIIRDGAYLNFASIYNESIGNPWFVMRLLINEKKKDFASWIASNEPTIQQKLNELVDAYKN